MLDRQRVLAIPGLTRAVRYTTQARARSISVKNLVVRFVREEGGQDLIEYALLAALIAVASIVAMQALGGKISGLFDNIGTQLDAAKK